MSTPVGDMIVSGVGRETTAKIWFDLDEVSALQQFGQGEESSNSTIEQEMTIQI
jgi:hypothetical protein